MAKPAAGTPVDSGHALGSKCVAFWPMVEATGLTCYEGVAGRTATFGTGMSWSTEAGEPCISLTGASTQGASGTGIALGGGTGSTVIVRYRITVDESGNYFWQSGSNGSNYECMHLCDTYSQSNEMRLFGSDFTFDWDGGKAINVIHEAAYTLSSGGVGNFYLDGVLQTSGSPHAYGTGFIGTSNWYLGHAPIASDYFQGKIIHVAIFNSVLSSTEISTFYGNPYDMFSASAPATSGAGTARARARLTTTGLPTRLGAATPRARARLTTTAASARSAAAVERASARISTTAGKAAAWAATFRAEGRLTTTFVKQGLTSAAARAIGRLTGSAAKASSGAAAGRGEGSLSGTGSTARAAQAILRARARLTSAAGSVPATNGAATLWAVARILATGAKGGIGSGLDRAEGRLTSANVTARAGAAILRASARAVATSGALPPAFSDVALFRASGRIIAAAGKGSLNASAIAGFARMGATGAKLGQGTATYRARAVLPATGRRGGVGTGLYRAAGVLQAAGAAIHKGAAVLRARGFATSPRELDPIIKGGRALVLSGVGRAAVRSGGRAAVTSGPGKVQL